MGRNSLLTQRRHFIRLATFHTYMRIFMRRSALHIGPSARHSALWQTRLHTPCGGPWGYMIFALPCPCLINGKQYIANQTSQLIAGSRSVSLGLLPQFSKIRCGKASTPKDMWWEQNPIHGNMKAFLYPLNGASSDSLLTTLIDHWVGHSVSSEMGLMWQNAGMVTVVFVTGPGD